MAVLNPVDAPAYLDRYATINSPRAEQRPSLAPYSEPDIAHETLLDCRSTTSELWRAAREILSTFTLSAPDEQRKILIRWREVFLDAAGLSARDERSQKTLDGEYERILNGSAKLKPFSSPHLQSEIDIPPLQTCSEDGFRELAFTYDDPMSFRLRILSQIIARCTVLSESKTLSLDTISVLSDQLQHPNTAGMHEASAVALGQIARMSQDAELRESALNHLAFALYSESSQARHYAREGLIGIAAQSPQLLLTNAGCSMLVRGLREQSSTSCHFARVVEALYINAPLLCGNSSHMKSLLSEAKLASPDSPLFWLGTISKSVDRQCAPLIADIQIQQLRMSPDASVLLSHNIREALGDEWIRNSTLVGSLLDLNPTLRITLVSTRPYLYNNPRIKVVSPEQEESLRTTLEGTSYNLVVDQYFQDNYLSESLCRVVKGAIQKSDLSFSTPTASNYFTTTYASYQELGGQPKALPFEFPLDNSYDCGYRFSAALGLPLRRSGPREVLFGQGTITTEAHWAEVLAAKKRVQATEICLINPFGGTYEEKGLGQFEITTIREKIEEQISKRALVLLNSNGSPWASQELIDTIVSGLTPESQKFVFTQLPSCKDDPQFCVSLLSLVDRIISVEGGLTHLGFATGKPIEILKVKGGGPTLMWFPYQRNSEGEETIFTLPPLPRSAQTPAENLPSLPQHLKLQLAVEHFCAQHSEKLNVQPKQLLEFLEDPDQLAFPIRFMNRSALSDQVRDRTVSDFFKSIPQEILLELYKKKWQVPERNQALREFLRECYGTGSTDSVEIINVRELTTARAESQGHFVHQLTLKLENKIVTIYSKGQGWADLEALQRYEGWDNRSRFFLYESFFYKAAQLAGLTRLQSRFTPESRDKSVIGLNFIQQAKGQTLDSLLSELPNSETLDARFLKDPLALVKEFARWCAFSELISGGDRRVCNLSDHYHRSANYFINQSRLPISVTGIDHELLFCKQPCVEFDRDHGANETALIKLFPQHAQLGAEMIFRREFIRYWESLTDGHHGPLLENLVRREFGHKSEEYRVFMRNAAQRADDLVERLLSHQVVEEKELNAA